MRLSLLVMLLTVVVGLNGQSGNKGKFYLSGNTSLTNATTLRNTVDQTNFESSQIGFFLTNRLLFGAELLAGTEDDLYRDGSFTISPFVRYYLPLKNDEHTRLFAEAGFGTIGNFGFGSSFETDFHLGGGVEKNFGEGVVGTGRLRYKVNASGFNRAEIDLGLNFVLGGPQSWQGFSGREKGAFLVDPRLGKIGFSHRSRGSIQGLELDLNLGLGYFLNKNLLVEAGYKVNFSDFTLESFDIRRFRSDDWEAFAGLRYFLPKTTGRFQPFALARVGWAGFSDGIENGTGFQTNAISEGFAEVGAGSLFFLTRKVALDASVRYRSELDVFAGSERSFGASVGLKVFMNGNR